MNEVTANLKSSPKLAGESDASMNVSGPGTVTVEEVVEVVEVVEYKTPQPNIPAGTRFRVLPKNFRNQLCGCNSGIKFKKCCLSKVTSENTYKVPSAETN
jgi:hypothetical protein